MNQLILIMIDGLSADSFAKKRSILPNLDQLAKTGMQVNRVAPEIFGTSMPGRTSIITGEPPHKHGIYANKLLFKNGFN